MLWTAALAALTMVSVALRTEAWRRGAPSPPHAATEGDPATVALVPARDEESNIVACLESILQQESAPRVVLIDDASSDRTRALAEGLAATEPRLRVEAAQPLEPGWRGKVNALAGALPQVTEAWILLVDADARLSPELLGRAHAAASRWRLDAVSIAGTQQAGGVGEALLVPAVFGLLDFMLGDWHAAADGRGPAVASGQFVLVRRVALLESGGFAALSRAVIDDVALVTNLRQHGFRTGFVRAPDLLRVRMYQGLPAAIAGWRRNLGAIFGGQRARGAFTLVALAAPAALMSISAALHDWPAVAVVWAGGAVMSAILRRGGRQSAALGLLYPLDALLLAGVLALGLADRRRGLLASWKGRAIDVSPAAESALEDAQSGSADSKIAS